jgi:heme-degrading monooxygenase HmoA
VNGWVFDVGGIDAMAVARCWHDVRVSIVKINAITVPRERFADFERRFASRAGRVSAAEGFERFQLLRPNDERELCLVVTQWRSEEDFRAWVQSADFAAGHSQHRTQGPVGTASELWSFDVLETEVGPDGSA